MSYKGLEGSGPRALENNDQAMIAAEQRLAEIRQRAANGEDVDQELRRAVAHVLLLKKDRGMIESAGV